MTADTPDRCEPPEHLRGVDGWHWVEARKLWCWADMDDRTLAGFSYHSPVATPEEVEALRNDATASRWALEAALVASDENVALRAELRRCETSCFDVQRDNITLRARVETLEAALRLLVTAHETGRYEPQRIAYEIARAALGGKP